MMNKRGEEERGERGKGEDKKKRGGARTAEGKE